LWAEDLCPVREPDSGAFVGLRPHRPEWVGVGLDSALAAEVTSRAAVAVRMPVPDWKELGGHA